MYVHFSHNVFQSVPSCKTLSIFSVFFQVANLHNAAIQRGGPTVISSPCFWAYPLLALVLGLLVSTFKLVLLVKHE